MLASLRSPACTSSASRLACQLTTMPSSKRLFALDM
jgi:hypothetical protein